VAGAGWRWQADSRTEQLGKGQGLMEGGAGKTGEEGLGAGPLGGAGARGGASGTGWG
jgi:hypothetical protein